MLKVVIYEPPRTRRSRVRTLNDSLQAGFKRHNVQVIRTSNTKVQGDLVTSWGWNNKPIFDMYVAEGARSLFWDLGYWARDIKRGYCRFAIDGWETYKSMPFNAPSDRFDIWGFDVAPRNQQPRNEILIAAMSKKGAATHGYGLNQWEHEVVRQIQRMNLPYKINLRQKPNKNVKIEPLSHALARTHLIVSHHSNVSIDGLFHGIPSYCTKGVGLRVSQSKLTADTLTKPYFPDRDVQLQTLYNIAYCQWSFAEMKTGAAWEYIRTCL